MCRFRDGRIQFLLAHPGGPYFARKDDGIWTIPKGMLIEGEDPLDAAKREFQEETGLSLRSSEFVPLGDVRQRSGKIVHAWAFVGDCDPSQVVSNFFEAEWPPRSGLRRSFPEVDRAEFFEASAARRKLVRAQAAFIDRAVSWFDEHGISC